MPEPMAPSPTSLANPCSIWFGRVVWLGVLVNLSFALPAIFVPELVLGALDLEPTTPHIWVRFSGLLLSLLSILYLPAARNPFHYRAIAWLSIAARATSATFFATAVFGYGKPLAYLPFGLVDMVFAVAQGVLFVLALRSEKWA